KRRGAGAVAWGGAEATVAIAQDNTQPALRHHGEIEMASAVKIRCRKSGARANTFVALPGMKRAVALAQQDRQFASCHGEYGDAVAVKVSHRNQARVPDGVTLGSLEGAVALAQ